MDVALLIRQRLRQLGLEQKDLAEAVEVTESYVSQLLARKKAPPAAGRTDLYDKIGQFLDLPPGKLARLAEEERRLERKKKLSGPLRPLFQHCRELILRKCHRARRAEVRGIFEKEPFGELERLVTGKVLDVAQAVAREELRNEAWLHSVAELSGRSYEEMRVAILEFLDTDILQVSLEGCVSFLDPMIHSWDIDLKTFGIEIALSPRLAGGSVRQFGFVEISAKARRVEPALEQFLRDKVLSGDATEEEVEFLRLLPLRGRRPTMLYYHRELQNLRDPLHFREKQGD